MCVKAGLPEPQFEEQQGFRAIFRRDIYSEKYLQSLGLNERQIKAVLFVKERGKITNKDYQRIVEVSKPTASRELASLVELNIFRQQGITGKGTFYILESSSNDS
jgi:ATP-dependent DNA helicase RecG